jgi:hypothetical protein
MYHLKRRIHPYLGNCLRIVFKVPTEIERRTWFHPGDGSLFLAEPYHYWYGSAIMRAQEGTYRQRLREVAEESYGYVTTRDLVGLNIPPVELRKLASRGKLEHIRRGVYRFPDTRPTERDEFMAAILSVGEDAFLTHDAVLALHGLALVNIKKIRVATPHRIRHKVPAFVEVSQRTLPRDQLEVFEGIPTTTVARAIIDSRDLVMPERLKEALATARLKGLVTRKEAREVRVALNARTAK